MLRWLKDFERQGRVEREWQGRRRVLYRATPEARELLDKRLDDTLKATIEALAKAELVTPCS